MVQPGIYEHYKGRRYRVIGNALHSETMEPFVVYESLYENPKSNLWIRPTGMFTENVFINGENVPRFKLISEDGTKNV